MRNTQDHVFASFWSNGTRYAWIHLHNNLASASSEKTEEGVNIPAFGPDGNLYVGHPLNEVLRYDGATGEFIDYFFEFANNGGLEGGFDLIFIPDAVPEPGTLALLGLGLLGLGLTRRRTN